MSWEVFHRPFWPPVRIQGLEVLDLARLFPYRFPIRGLARLHGNTYRRRSAAIPEFYFAPFTSSLVLDTHTGRRRPGRKTCYPPGETAAENGRASYGDLPRSAARLGGEPDGLLCRRVFLSPAAFDRRSSHGQ